MLSRAENLNKIKSLLEKVKELKAISDVTSTGVKYNTSVGKCSGKVLMNIGSIAVQDATLDSNTTLKEHIHYKEEEVLIIYNGDLTIITKDSAGKLREEIIQDKGVIIIPPNTAHIVSSNGGCKLIGITIPASDGYPK